MNTHWIWQQADWPHFHWQDAVLLPRLRHLQQQRGLLLGRASLHPDSESQTLDTLLSNILSSSAIEEERVNVQSVRSSLARRLGVTEEQPWPVSDRSEGLAAMMLDAINNRSQPLTMERLYQWHHWLFPADEWTVQRLSVGMLRGSEPMQVVSGRIDRPTVHFEAPPRDGLEPQLAQFIAWFNQSQQDVMLDPLLRAAICHLWFVTLHPFDDGNGRITRALTDLALAQADSQSIRLYAMSPAILAHRADYYCILEQTQKGDTDITRWLVWFLDILDESLQQAMSVIDRTQIKARFWLRYQGTGLSQEQVKVLNRLLDGGEQGFEQGISASQYQKVAKVSKATATRHLADLVEKGCLYRLEGGGRSTRYQVNTGETP
ncbi:MULTISPECIES: Fic family protein [unclassified Pantoea]|uniref:Fic family protein n=1 Tax=unclassified Pantoea TaxID=2630326 RepID=UPI0012328778|nr:MULTISPECIES: Fic family protein [unclassified Pantoea]KAA5974259.1 Fic family protein [Pantoea sp. M_6]KAA5978050.1 Fic family protein [Pantoea sp. M_8]KAA5989764.1 Fic family protein [Pantoea sp. M_10]